jgi:hypothetical protein
MTGRGRVDPRAGKALSLSVHMPFVADDIQGIYDYRRIPDGSMQTAFAKVVPGAMKRQAEREEQRVVSDAVEHAFANCGAKQGEMLTSEHKAKLVRLVVERMAPYVTNGICQQPSLPMPTIRNPAPNRKRSTGRKKRK